MRHGLILAVALPCTAQAAQPVSVNPADDGAAARTLIEQYRTEFSRNQAIVARCQRASETGCQGDPDCSWETGGGTLGVEQECRATDAVFHAWQQEHARRLCDRSTSTTWVVYQVTAERAYGECRCPAPTLLAFIADGYTGFSLEQRRCTTEREACTARGGTLRSPELVALTGHPLLLQVPPRDSRFACENGVYPVEHDLFIHPRWMEEGGSGRCELAVLRGFLKPHLQTRFDDPTPAGVFDFEMHPCEGVR